MKNGLIMADGKLIYYVDDMPKHAGVIEVDGAIYYIGSHGLAIKGRHVVRTAMSNGILKHGTYTFGDDYKLVEGSYIPPEKVRTGKKRKKTVKKLLKNKKIRILVPVALLAAVVLALFMAEESLVRQSAVQTSGTSASVQQGQSAEYDPVIMLPTFDEEVLLCSEAAQQVYKGELNMADVYKTGDPYRGMVFQYNLQGADGLLKISESQSLSGGVEYILPQDSTVLVVDNLKTGTNYYYKVTVGKQEYAGSFSTAKSTRFVTIPGAKNTRDIGGYETLDGKTVKQGLLIRGTELDGLENPYYVLAVKDVDEVQNTFGFVHDMDLRYNTLFSGMYQTPLGKDVSHTVYTSPQYGEIFNSSWQDSLRSIFRDLADPQKYPMYVHCSAGKDRTGTVVFLLQGVLNMSEDAMRQEFHRSGFAFHEMADISWIDAVVNGVQPYAGDTLQEKIVTFLTTVIGVTDAEIESIRNIFLED